MAKVARRKKVFEKDGAQLVISPLTYGQVDEYAAKQKAVNEKFKDKDPKAKAGEPNAYAPEDYREYANIRFWVICCALNNATPEAGLTEDDIKNEMESGILEPLWEDIIRFSGLEVPLKSKEAAAGETGAGS